MATPTQRSDATAAERGSTATSVKSNHVAEEPSTSASADSTGGSLSDQRPLRKSVSFPKHITDADVGAHMARGSRARETDSSADETTGILNSEQGNGRNYATASATASATDRPASVAQRKRRQSAQGAETRSDSRPRWKQLLDQYGAVELENKGSVARDHLALERTFLAWLRTSLSFASIGIAITQLFRLNTSITGGGGNAPSQQLRQVGKPLGVTFIGISIVVLFIGFHRYFESQHYVIRGRFPASRGSIVVVAAIAGALIVSSLIVILAIGRGEFES